MQFDDTKFQKLFDKIQAKLVMLPALELAASFQDLLAGQIVVEYLHRLRTSWWVDFSFTSSQCYKSLFSAAPLNRISTQKHCHSGHRSRIVRTCKTGISVNFEIVSTVVLVRQFNVSRLFQISHHSLCRIQMHFRRCGHVLSKFVGRALNVWSSAAGNVHEATNGRLVTADFSFGRFARLIETGCRAHRRFCPIAVK